MQLDAYLNRIGYKGSLTPDLATLTAIHRAHLLAITYENLDIHRACPVTVDLPQIYEKIVNNGRGGWCFEMNGLLGWALCEVGFDVTLLSSCVGRGQDEPVPEGAGDDLILRVDLDKPYLADAGFGNGFLEPIPLAEGEYQQGIFTYKLAQKGGRWWFQNHAGPGYDFDLQPHQLTDFTPSSNHLQTSPESGFVKNTVCLRFTPDGMLALRGAVYKATSPQGMTEETVDNITHYQALLTDVFGLRVPDTERIWERVWARHQAWLKEQG